jgi:hypothetical protein
MIAEFKEKVHILLVELNIICAKRRIFYISDLVPHRQSEREDLAVGMYIC